MRKRLLLSNAAKLQPKANERTTEEWLAIDQLAIVEITSEDPRFPVDSALVAEKGPCWRAAASGPQTIRIIFDTRRPLRRISLVFSETENERTQQFTLRWSPNVSGPFREIVRQQWNFSPQGSTREAENYAVELDSVAALELAINPNIASAESFASLDLFRMR
jgi:hypothetical protein